MVCFDADTAVRAIFACVPSPAALTIIFLTFRHLRLQSAHLALRRTVHMTGTLEPIVVPEGFTLHTENTSHILLPSTNEAFLNPIQEFNRDLSVAAIRVWSEELNQIKEKRWRQAQQRKADKRSRPDKKRKLDADGEDTL